MTQLKKIAFFSLYYWPVQPGSGTMYPYSLTHSLASMGNQVTVLTGNPILFKRKNFPGPKKKLLEREFDNGVQVIRLPIPSWRPYGVIRRLIVYMWFVMIALLSYPMISDSDYVFGFSPDAPFLLLPNIFFAWIMKKKYILGVTDLWPDALYELGAVKGKLGKFLIKTITLASYRSAPKILTITNELKSGLAKYGLEERNIITTGIPVNLQDCETIDCAKSALDPFLKDDSFVVLYSGIFGPMYDFKVLFECARQLEAYENIRFVIRGNGERLAEINQALNELKPRNLVVRSSGSARDALLKYISVSDVCIVPLAGSASADRTMPSKVLEFWGFRKPVIAVSNGHLKKVIEKYRAGSVVPLGNSQELARTILYHYHNRDISKSMGEMGRILVEDQYSYQSVGQKLSTMINV